MDASKLVTVVIANYKTPQLVRGCFTSLRKVYPTVPVVLVDNGSKDASTEYIKARASKDVNVLAILNPSNLGHGPALHLGVLASHTPYVFTLDSDCAVLRRKFLEGMLEVALSSPETYAIGWLRFAGKAIEQVHPWGMLIDASMYLTLAPFIHGPRPAAPNMFSARAQGLKLVDFPISTFIKHKAQGTRRLFPGRPWDPTEIGKHS